MSTTSVATSVERRSLIEQLQQPTRTLPSSNGRAVSRPTRFTDWPADPQPDHPMATQCRPVAVDNTRTAAEGKDAR